MEEVGTLTSTWSRLWGKQNERGGPQLSFWSMHDAKTGGVAILLNPSMAKGVTAWQQEKWTQRVMALTIGDLQIFNIYAPSDRPERECFFDEVQAWPKSTKDVILAGDFNCVQCPVLDRLGGHRSGRPESETLTRLLRKLHLEDARTLEEHAEEESENPEPTEFFTYWDKKVASRIDRFYVPLTWTAVVQRVSVDEPQVASDHQRVRLHFRDHEQPTVRKRCKRAVQYPIRTAHPEQVNDELFNELVEAGVGNEVTVKNWDKTAKECVNCIQKVSQRVKQRRKAVVHRINDQNRAHLLTRKELLRVTEEDLREELLVRQGQRLERTTERLRWSFKRVSNWEKDQTIKNIRQINGEPFQRNMSIANRFSSEWKPILGVEHNKVAPSKLEAEFDKFVAIPPGRRLSDQQNAGLMEDITADEVTQAIAALNRHKAAGGDGLNNDFFKDTQSVLIPAMVTIGNELLRGSEPPPSFLEGLIIPLRKKGDSDDAMDFRPISLLQTGYKVFTKVIATRAQKVMGTPIGDSQQGFVHGRQMIKTVMMMLAILATARGDPELAAEFSQVILLLDFRKAYDTVARDFLFMALRKFGFSEAFITMIQRLHDGTTARFLVNGELSEPQEVRSGIRQGCPLAPLLFILAAEILALAIAQDPEIQGIEIPGGAGERHAFSAFVDDSTAFLQQAQQLPRVMEIVKQFGRLSGLQVQPTKSHLIFLNTAIKLKEYLGIPVLAPGDTVRYLGYAVGTGELTDINWAARIRSVQRRLATATQLATSVDNRVTLLNVIMLPSVLFTAAVFEMPKWATNQLINLQKQFLWHHSTATESSKHKINPGLVFAPRQAGGVGLASIQLACKTQRVKHAMQWLIQRRDKYFPAWRAWMFRGETQNWEQGISPRKDLHSPMAICNRTPGNELQQLIGEWVQPGEDISAEQILQYQKKMEDYELEALSWFRKDEWILELPTELPPQILTMTTEGEQFWPTYKWSNNPWIVDKSGKMLTAKKYGKIQDCTIASLCIERTESLTYSFKVPVKGDKHHQQAKLKRWGLAILMSSPRIALGEQLRVGIEVRPRHQTKLQHQYSWRITGSGKVTGTVINEVHNPCWTIEVVQKNDGIHWEVLEASNECPDTKEDRRRMQRFQDTGSVVFYAHPGIHGFPWRVPDTIANKHVGVVVKQQPFKRYRGAADTLDKVLEGLQEVVKDRGWQMEAMQQTPKQLWAHRNELTEYQVWVSYRVAVRQLNLNYKDRSNDNSCRKLTDCSHAKETIEHIFWDCPCAQECWKKLIRHWTGERWAKGSLDPYRKYCASRQPPPISTRTKVRIGNKFPDEETLYEAEWRRVWRIASSICVTILWMQRNRVVFKHEEISAKSSVTEFWETTMRQLRAIAKRERNKPEKQIQGIRLLLCQQALQSRPREHFPQGVSLVQPPDLDQAPALLTRLRTYQTSSR